MSHIYFYKYCKDLLRIYKELQNNFKELKNNYEYLQIKYNSKQWVRGIMNPLISGMLAGYSTSK